MANDGDELSALGFPEWLETLKDLAPEEAKFASVAKDWGCCTWRANSRRRGVLWGVRGERLASHFKQFHRGLSLEVYLALRKRYEAELALKTDPQDLPERRDPVSAPQDHPGPVATRIPAPKEPGDPAV